MSFINPTLNTKIILFPLLSAMLVFLSYPDCSFAPMAFIAFAPLLSAVNRIRTFYDCIKLSLFWALFLSCFLGFFIKFAVIDHYGFSWITFTLFFSLGLILPNAVIFLFFCSSAVFLRPQTASVPENIFFTVFTIPALWIFHEYLKELLPFMIPWGNAGYAPFGIISFIQTAELGGVYLVSFLVIAINSSIAALADLFFIKKINLKKTFISMPGCLYGSAVIIILTGSLLYGNLSIASMDRIISENENSGIQASAVQISHSNEDRWDSFKQHMVITDYVEMSGFDKTVPALTVWPETIITSPGALNDTLLASLVNLIHEESVLVVGGIRRSEQSRLFHNSAYFINGNSTLRWYDKVILLPFSETAPFGLGFGSIYDAPSEFKPGKTAAPVQTPPGRISATICFEAIYPSLTREAVSSGAEYLINISNDSWFGNYSQPMTHLISSAMRSIENRRFMVRSSNSGYSAIISPIGRITKSGLNTKEKVTDIIYPLNNKTFYTRFGDWIIAVSMLFIVTSVLFNMFRNDKKK